MEVMMTSEVSKLQDSTQLPESKEERIAERREKVQKRLEIKRLGTVNVLQF
jgi:hypothetical protein